MSPIQNGAPDLIIDNNLMHRVACNSYDYFCVCRMQGVQLTQFCMFLLFISALVLVLHGTNPCPSANG